MRTRRLRSIGIAGAVMLMAGALGACAQTGTPVAAATASAPVYDVATVKLNKTMSGSSGFDTNDATFQATNVSLKSLLQRAYGIKQEQISGLPGWTESTRYDIFAKSLDADPALLKKMKPNDRRAMLRKLLEERFQIKSHIEVKTLPIFEMEVVNEGARFKEFVPSGSDDEGGDMSMNGENHQVTMTARGVTMQDLAATLTERVDHTVVDKTGLLGKYDLQLKWLRDDAPLGGDDAPPPILIALQEQLGLKLVASRGPVNTLVIDRITQPTEN